MVGSYIMIFFSIFITSFICTDYSCQTIRNKLIVGHSRAALYFSNFITAWIGSLVIAAAYLITIAVLTVFLGLETGMPPNELCFFILTQIAAVTALVSFYVLLSELITSKSKAVTTALILSLVLSIMYPIMGDMHIGFNVQAAKVISNAISVFFTDIMPSGQLVQMEMGADIQRIFPVYSLAVTAASSAIGILIFKRKGLK
ncbi:MAG: ABC transporter permease [Oscillospiraceae bacterium]|nr:ABC transporter permease [Oscillospiraceae bacterium]